MSNAAGFQVIIAGIERKIWKYNFRPLSSRRIKYTIFIAYILLNISEMFLKMLPWSGTGTRSFSRLHKYIDPMLLCLIELLFMWLLVCLEYLLWKRFCWKDMLYLKGRIFIFGKWFDNQNHKPIKTSPLTLQQFTPLCLVVWFPALQ